ncbi:MAG: type I polyketide synthase [Actinobacteria bacterium]|nr:MAG: type I polyketide synthase [Actinomycetota bacterium]
MAVPDDGIAVIGVAAKVPGARDVEEYWLNLVRGRESVTVRGDEQPDAGCFDAEFFDAEFFGMTPRQAQACDPRLRLFLEVAHSAIENAGYDPAALRDRVGVFASAGPPDLAATTVSDRLGLRGPGGPVLTACSSALVALHRAWRSLRTDACDVAVAGGAEVAGPSAADGTVLGSGACAVLVKRLADALADRDHISAVIRGVAVILDATVLAGLRPEDISYVEAHGTGTALGDPVEVAALTEAYPRCRIGSVQGNVGHLGAVAGMAGLVKVVLSLEREQLPPSINFTAPDPRLNLASTPLRVPDRLTSWPRDPCRPRRAAVGAMGTDGSNVHVVLEEPPEHDHATHGEEPRVVVWSGMTGDAERAARETLGRFFTSRGEAVFADAVATLQHGRAAHRVRAAAVCTSAYDAAAVLWGAEADRIRVGRPVPTPRPVSLLFPGEGPPRVGMAHGLYRDIPAFAAALDGWFDLLDSDDLPLRDHWSGGADGPGTVFAEPLLFAIEAALARLWQDAGVRPAALLGYGIGELVAATVAGVFAPADAARLVLARARATPDPPAVTPAPPRIPVHSADALDALLATGEGVLVEVGPAPVLTALAGRHPRVRQGAFAVVPTLADDGDTRSFLSAAAQLWTEGHPIAWERIGQAPPRQRVPVPGYAYQRTRLRGGPA